MKEFDVLLEINRKGLELYIDRYTQLFCDKHEVEYNPENWIGGKGEVIEIGDMFINFSDIRIDLEEKVSKEIFAEWYWNVTENNLLFINYKSWIKGLRPKDLKS
jgi:hypothetical protein